MPDKTRACPLRDWPIADRQTWERACLAAQRLKPGGAASHMKRSTQTSLERAYGYLLGFCRRNGVLDENTEAGAHVTPEVIAAFVDELCNRVGSVTRATYIEKIRRVATILAPDRDLVWLREIENELRNEARPRQKYHRIVPSHRLLALGLELIKRGETGKHLTNLARRLDCRQDDPPRITDPAAIDARPAAPRNCGDGWDRVCRSQPTFIPRLRCFCSSDRRRRSDGDCFRASSAYRPSHHREVLQQGGIACCCSAIPNAFLIN